MYYSTNSFSIILFFYTVTIGIVLWYVPLNWDGIYFTKFQESFANDQNFYLYKAHQNCIDSAFYKAEDNFVTWSAFWTLSYLSVGCKVFGSINFYLLLNPILLTLQIRDITKILGLRKFSNSELSFLLIVMLPLCFWSTLPGKEFFSILCILSLIKIYLYRSFSTKDIIFVSMGIVSRPHEIVPILMLCCLVYLKIFRVLKFSRILIFLVLLFLGFDTGQKILGMTFTIKMINFEILGIPSSVFASENIAVHFMLSPLRAIIMLAYPLSVFLNISVLENLSVSRMPFIFMKFYDFLLLVILAYRLLDIDKIKLNLLLFLICYLCLISFNGLEEKTRYVSAIIALVVTVYQLYGLRFVSR